MERAVRVLQVPARLIDRAERAERLPPGSGLLIAFAGSFLFYAAMVAVIA